VDSRLSRAVQTHSSPKMETRGPDNRIRLAKGVVGVVGEVAKIETKTRCSRCDRCIDQIGVKVKERIQPREFGWLGKLMDKKEMKGYYCRECAKDLRKYIRTGNAVYLSLLYEWLDKY